MAYLCTRFATKNGLRGACAGRGHGWVIDRLEQGRQMRQGSARRARAVRFTLRFPPFFRPRMRSAAVRAVPGGRGRRRPERKRRVKRYTSQAYASVLFTSGKHVERKQDEQDEKSHRESAGTDNNHGARPYIIYRGACPQREISEITVKSLILAQDER